MFTAPTVQDRLRIGGSNSTDVLHVLAWAVRNKCSLHDALGSLRRFWIAGTNPIVGFATLWIPWPIVYFWRSHNTSQAKLNATIHSLKAGDPLMIAFQKGVGRIMPRHVTIAMNEAECEGRLPETLDLLARQAGRSHELDGTRNRMISLTMFYLIPAYLGGVYFFVTISPRLYRMMRYIGYGVPQPDILKFTFGLSSAMDPWVLLIPAAVFVFLLVLSSKSFSFCDYCLIYIPILGKAVRTRARVDVIELVDLGLLIRGDLNEATTWAWRNCRSGWGRGRIRKLRLLADNGVDWAEAWQKAGLGSRLDRVTLSAALEREVPHEGFAKLAAFATAEARRIARRNERWFPFCTMFVLAPPIILVVFSVWTWLSLLTTTIVGGA